MAHDQEFGIDVARATEDAETISRLSAKLDNSFTDMVEGVNREINSGINTEWARTLKENLEKYRNTDMAEATTDMAKSATNISMTTEKAQSYSNETDQV